MIPTVKQTAGMGPLLLALCLLALGALAHPSEKPGTLPVARVIRQISFGNQQGNFGSGRPRPQQGGRPLNTNQGGFRPRPQGGQPQSQQCSNCLPPLLCPDSKVLSLSPCNGGAGICCPFVRSSSPTNRALFTEQRPRVQMRPVSNDEVTKACEKGLEDVKDMRRLETNMIRSGRVLKEGTPEHGHLKFFRLSSTARTNHRKARAVNQASLSMLNDFRLSSEQGKHALRNIPVRNSALRQNCPVSPQCNRNAKYRTIDGTCNNLANPLYGKSETAFQRIIPPKYNDGVSSPSTKDKFGGEMPSERIVASTVLVDRNDEDQEFTTSVMQWAQFIDHDLTHAPFMSLENGEGIECCHEDGSEIVGDERHPDCWPIKIPRNDPFYAPKGRFCMNFVRSMVGLSQDCTFGYAEQMNQITHHLDASNIYGSNEEEANRLRAGQGGLLKVSQNNMLPIDPVSGGECAARDRGARCYHAGDGRVNEQPGLTAIHTIFHREHNRVAQGLRSINPGWSDHELYQEARRIVTAEYQHIIYNEWLPIIVGTAFMQSFGISPLLSGYSYDYSESLNPNMNNEFATAAFRFGHSLVQGTIRLFNANNREKQIRLRDHFNSPHIFQQDANAVDQFARSFTKQQIQKFDSFVTDDLSNHLFQPPRMGFGMDLMSLNLHRARDHGLASYNSIREVCGLRRADNFAQLNDQIPLDIIPRLERMYKHPDDIDFFVGGMSEKPVAPGLLGWTFLCVVGDQFARARKGDRFFYDLGGQPGSFNANQLTEIRKASWARILCDNTKIGQVQPLAFRTIDSNINQLQNCNSGVIPQVNLNNWRNERTGF